MKSITEEMRFRQRLCEYAIKYGVTRAARRYQTNRQFVYRQFKNMTEMSVVLHLNQEDRTTIQMLIVRKNLLLFVEC